MTKRLRDDAIAGLLKQPIADCLIGSTFSIAHHCDERGYQSYGDDEYELINKTPIKRRKRDEILASDSECSDVRTKLELSTDGKLCLRKGITAVCNTMLLMTLFFL